ncbi:ABC transporter permease [Pectinatus sottacetonis]|uniref:ABC transporter permease n=1 Tax=Pectinatus sottacetonis TaxID=1002795 RepID=UPI0018C4FB40|nr:ABC transporter permease [Pectinatus sottacetonis]
MSFLQIMKREVWQFFTADEKTRVLFLFGAGLAYLFLFGFLYKPGIVKNIPLVIYDQDQSKLSRELIWNFECDESFKLIEQVDTREKMLQDMKQKKTYTALEIPKNFSKNSKTGSCSTALFMINGANIIITNIASNEALSILDNFSDKLAVHQIALRLGVMEESLKNRINPINGQFRIMGNPTQSYLLFFIIGLSMAAFQQGIFLSVGSALQYEYKNVYILKEKRVSCSKLLLAKVILYWLLAMLTFLLIIFLIINIWGIFMKSSLYMVILLGGTFVFAAVSFGLMMAAMFKTLPQFVRGSIMYTVPAFVLAGYTFPQQSMLLIPRIVSYFFPFSWFVNSLRELFLLGYSANLGQHIAILLIMGVSCCSLADIAFNARVKRHYDNNIGN